MRPGCIRLREHSRRWSERASAATADERAGFLKLADTCERRAAQIEHSEMLVLESLELLLKVQQMFPHLEPSGE